MIKFDLFKVSVIGLLISVALWLVSCVILMTCSFEQLLFFVNFLTVLAYCLKPFAILCIIGIVIGGFLKKNDEEIN